MQQKLADAQARIAELVVEGTSGGGMVKVTLKGTGDGPVTIRFRL